MFTKDGNYKTEFLELFSADEDTTYVGQDDFRSSNAKLYSEYFSSCVAILFLDYNKTLGAMAHASSATPIQDLMAGYMGRFHKARRLRKVDMPSSIYSDPSLVKIIEVFDSQVGSWKPSEIRIELEKEGYRNFSCLALKNKHPRPLYSKDIGLDVKKGLIYIETRNNNGIITVPFFDDNGR